MSDSSIKDKNELSWRTSELRWGAKEDRAGLVVAAPWLQGGLRDPIDDDDHGFVSRGHEGFAQGGGLQLAGGALGVESPVGFGV